MSFVQARRVASLSWPLYAGAACFVIAAVVLLPFVASTVFRWALGLSVVGTIAVSAASFWAFHLMFDESDLLRGTWLRNTVAAPERWIEITTALEQTTLPIESLFPAAKGERIDIYDPATMTEPAITRARDASHGTARSTRIEDVPTASADLVVMMLAAHEIRAREGRGGLFAEVARVLSPSGCVVLVEHLRDFAAVLAFGPGALHFFPRSEWLELAASAGLSLTREFPITPFVRVFVFKF